VISVLAKGDEFVKLARQQAVLAQMLRRFADRTNALSRLEQMEVQELAHQQRRVHEALRTWTTQLQELVARVPADAQYDPLRQDIEKFLKAVADAGIESDLSQAAIALGEPDTITGSVLAQRAADAMDKLIARCEAMPDTGRQCLAARFQPSLMKTGLADAVGQILAAMGAGSGYGDRDGYSLFNEDVALYGPNAELAGEQAGGRMDTAGGSGGTRTARLVAEPRDPGLHPPEVPGRVRPQTDAPFPLRYRDLVGEYFRTIAESAKEGEKQ
jgi:hypothetical protein